MTSSDSEPLHIIAPQLDPEWERNTPGKGAPLILITNDDGFDAPGLWHLVRAAAPLARVGVIAPHTQQSWAGRSHRTDPVTKKGQPALASPGGPTVVHTHDRHWLMKVPLPDVCYSIGASPARCVCVALHAMKLKPDFILSGVNDDPNLGTVITSSGTLGAAWEAAESGVPAIAFSKETILNPEETPAVLAHLNAIINQAITKGFPEGTGIANINLPKHVTTKTNWQVTTTSPTTPYQHWAEQADETTWIMHSKLRERMPAQHPNTDIKAMKDGRISITFIEAQYGILNGTHWR